MARRSLLLIPLLSLVILGLAGCTRPAPEPASLTAQARGFNVWLISVDTVRADRLGAWGYDRRPTSPVIDRLVGQGWRFDRATAPRAVTWPSLATVLTGLYPARHTVIYNGYSFPEGLATLPLLLSDAGYETAAFLSNMCQAGHAGWESFGCAGGNDGKVNRGTLEWLQGRDTARPFFLWTHYFGAHGPYYNGGDLASTQLDPQYEGELAPKKWILDRVMTESVPLSDRDVEHLDALYDAAVIGTDGLIGALLSQVEGQVDLSRTLIVFLSDHGEDLYRHNGYLYHACSVYQSSLQVPLAIVSPTLLAAGRSHAGHVSLADVAPTLLDLLGIAGPDDLDGTSLLPVLEGREATPREVFSEYGETRIATLWEDDWKLVHNPDALTPVCFPDGPDDLYPIGTVELYDLSRDPEEQVDLADRRPEVRDRLLERLERWRQDRAAYAAPEEQTIDPKLREELEALGYVVD